MRILCVDDEPAALRETEALCRALTQQPEVAGFTDPELALEDLKTHPADAAILDIRMPKLDGLALAEALRSHAPETAVIFLTSHEEYALEAFRLHVSGYLLKPCDPLRLQEEVDYALRDRPTAPPPVEAQTFGEFELLVDGAPVHFKRSKAKELLAYLIDRQGRGVSRAGVFAALWEDEQYDRGKQKYLDVVIRSLRQTLAEHGVSEILELKQGMLRIRPEALSCDLFRFFRGEAAAIDAYRGEYMSAYPWGSHTEAILVQISQSRHSR